MQNEYFLMHIYMYILARKYQPRKTTWGVSANLFTKIGYKVNYYEIIYMNANNIQLWLILKLIQFFTPEVQYSLCTIDVIKY